MQSRVLWLSALLIVTTFATGLALRLASLGLPTVLVKYGGSVLWALMIYWIVSSLRPRWLLIRCAISAGVIALGVELFKLYHTPALDGFRLTLPGKLLLGRVYSPSDLVAYSLAIVVGVIADRKIRSCKPPGPEQTIRRNGT